MVNRKAHIRELLAFHAWVVSRPCVVHKSMDALIPVYLHHVQRERKVCWATVERVATNIIGALSYARFYAVGVQLDAFAASRWGGFKHSLTTIRRKAAAMASTGPKPASYADVAQAYNKLTDAGDRAFLALAWFPASGLVMVTCLSLWRVKWPPDVAAPFLCPATRATASGLGSACQAISITLVTK